GSSRPRPILPGPRGSRSRPARTRWWSRWCSKAAAPRPAGPWGPSAWRSSPARPASRSMRWAVSHMKTPADWRACGWRVWRPWTRSELELGLELHPRLARLGRRGFRARQRLLVAQCERAADAQGRSDPVVSPGLDVVPRGLAGIGLLHVQREAPLFVLGVPLHR